jgi:uncharacterized protein
MKVRKPSFDLSTLSLYNFGGNAVATHLLNSFHVIVPIGELYFIRSVRPFLKEAKSDDLKTRLKSFIGQESVHDQVHRQVWNKLREQGLPVDSFARFFSDVIIKYSEPLYNRLFGEKASLSATVAFEHYTAALADTLFTPGSKLRSSMEGEMGDLWSWHAAEELEHKAVAFDLLKDVDDNYLLRATGMGVATSLLTFFTFFGAAWFIAGDKELKPAKLVRDLLSFNDVIGEVWPALTKHIADYLRPDFHPDQKENYDMAERALGELRLAG